MDDLIKFGTSGWRAIIGDQFTFTNVRRVCDAIAGTLIERGQARQPVAIGYDTRFLSEQFADTAARTLAARGVPCLMSITALPTPAVSHAIRHNHLAGAINITASHNPAEYNGLKFSTHEGAPSPPELTRQIESHIGVSGSAAAADGVADGAADLIEPADFKEPYLAQLESLVRFDKIRASGVTLAVDLRWGTARGYYDEILLKNGVSFTAIHDHRDVTFGGGGPDVSEKNLADLSRVVVERKLGLGVACDGDADRFGVVDSDGTWISPNLLLALLADYLAETRGFRQGLGRTYATTGLIDAVASHYDIPVHQTPVGFKYLGEQILRNKVYLAGEESAGMSMIGHVPEKDGLLAGLLAAEMVATRGCSLGQMREDLFEKVGHRYSRRDDFRVTPAETTKLKAHMQSPPSRLGDRTVAQHTVLDGLRLDFHDGAWLLMRPSGTEPVVRYYVEAPTERDLEELMKTGRAVLLGGSK